MARPQALPDWNLVVSAHQGEFASAIRLVERWGPAEKTAYYNVIVARLDDIEAFPEEFRREVEGQPRLLNSIARAVPAQEAFDFRRPEEFEDKAFAAAQRWISQLAGRSFHVRMHRRGFRKKLSSQSAEQFLDGKLLEALAARGSEGRIDFDDPDAILAVETVGGRAGLSLWSREELERYPFLGLD